MLNRRLTLTIFLVGVVVFLGLFSAPSRADVVLTDDTFNLANYTVLSYDPQSIVQSYTTLPTGGQIGGPALQFNFQWVYSPSDFAALGFTNTTLTYTPSLQGNIQSIRASIDKNIVSWPTADIALTSNTFRPLIEQDGNFYFAAIPGPTDVGVWNTISSADLMASDFFGFDFSTGTFNGLNPDFSGDTMEFGLAQILLDFSGPPIGGPNVSAEVRYDPLIIDIKTVPEPSSLFLLGTGLFGVAMMILRKRIR